MANTLEYLLIAVLGIHGLTKGMDYYQKNIAPQAPQRQEQSYITKPKQTFKSKYTYTLRDPLHFQNNLNSVTYDHNQPLPPISKENKTRSYALQNEIENLYFQNDTSVLPVLDLLIDAEAQKGDFESSYNFTPTRTFQYLKKDDSLRCINVLEGAQIRLLVTAGDECGPGGTVSLDNYNVVRLMNSSHKLSHPDVRTLNWLNIAAEKL